jgi:hypothetical protein
METLWSYRPEDFLLFSPDVYRRLFLLHNADFWWTLPISLALAALLGFALWVKGRRVSPGLVVGLALANGWILVGASFFLASYNSINWAAPYISPLFFLGGILLSAAALRRRFTNRASPARRFGGAALLLYGFLLHPIALSFLGWPAAGLEFALIAPDPTVIASLGLLLFGGGWLCRCAFALALVWCGASWLTLHTLGLVEAFLPATAALIAIAFAALGRRGG